MFLPDLGLESQVHSHASCLYPRGVRKTKCSHSNKNSYSVKNEKGFFLFYFFILAKKIVQNITKKQYSSE